MAKKSTVKRSLDPRDTAIATRPEAFPAPPDYAVTDSPMSVHRDGESAVMSYIKVLNPLTKSKEMLADYGVGAVVLASEGILLASEGEPFAVSPLLFFISYDLLGDYKDTTAESKLIERSFDPNGEIALKAKSFTSEPYPDNPKLKRTYTLTRNLIVSIEGGEADGVVASYAWNGGNWKAGSMLGGLLGRLTTAANPNRVQTWATRFNFYSKLLKNKAGDEWYGLVYDPKFTYNKKEAIERLTPIAVEAHRQYEAAASLHQSEPGANG